MNNNAKLLQGDEAVVEGAIAAGARFFAGYPITPASESGLKSITATSGPGFSLKQENLGLGMMIEAPCVVVNVQRVGPSTGLPTSPSQGDVMQAKWGTHGDHPVIALAPSSVKETFELTVKAFNFAERFRTPVILLLDEIVGHMREKVVLPKQEDIEIWDRKKPEVSPEDFNPYEETEDHIPPMPAYGEGYRYHTTGLFHDKTGFPRGTNEDAKNLMDRLMAKIESNMDIISLYEEDIRDDDEIIVLAYGSTMRSAINAISQARKAGIKAGWIKLKTIWPFPADYIKEVGKRAKAIIIPELNRGQIIKEVRENIFGNAEVHGINKYDGTLIKPEEILNMIQEVK